MKLYENTKDPHSRRANRCGYCREEGHNRLDCPHVAKDWESWAHFKVPARSQGWHRSRNYPKYWGEWYEDCRSTMIKQQEKEKNKMASTPVVRSAPKCGFCGERGHNRRNCTKMAAFIELCNKANSNWRRAFYDLIIEKAGLQVGTAVEVCRDSWAEDKEYHIGIISGVNLDKVNMFTACHFSYDDRHKYAQEFDVHVMIDGDVQHIGIKRFLSERGLIGDVVRHVDNHWTRLHLSKVISKTTTPLSNEWVESYKEAWQFLAKKKTYEELRNAGIVKHVEDWANRT